MKVGVIGTGGMGKHHARVLSELEGCELVGICDLKEDIAKQLARMYNTRAYTDYIGLLKREKPECVSLAVPTDSHAELAVDLLSRGLHVLVEKPIALNMKQARGMVDAAEKSGSKLMVGHIERFNPAVQKLRTILKKEDLVSISSMRVGPHPPPKITSGVILDMGIHEIDLIRHITGEEIRTVYAKTDNVLTRRHEDHAHVFLTTDNKSASVLTNWITPRKIRQTYLTLKDRFIYLNYMSQSISVYKKDVNGQTLALDSMGEVAEKIRMEVEEPLVNELRAFVDFCGGKIKHNPVSSEDAMEALRIALAAELSGKKREVIEL
jgi:UDP-N-acetylglucosamine 3-dehydrogenase